MSNFTEWLIVVCWAVFLIFIIFAAFTKKRTIKTDRTFAWSWIVLVLLALVVIAFFGDNVHLSQSDPTLWQRTALVNVSADVLVLLGLAIALWGRITLGRNWNLSPSLQEHHELIESGPYACVRHPMYAGLVLMLLGTVVMASYLVGFVIFFFCLGGTWFKLSREEKILTEYFGQKYLAYKARVNSSSIGLMENSSFFRL